MSTLLRNGHRDFRSTAFQALKRQEGDLPQELMRFHPYQSRDSIAFFAIRTIKDKFFAYDFECEHQLINELFLFRFP